MAAPRVYYAMARDGLFVEAVARTHSRFGTLVVAIAIQGTIASVLVGLGTFQQIIPYFMFVAVLFLGLTVGGLFIVRRRPQAQVPAMLAPAYPVTPLAFLMLIALLLALVLLRSPREAVLGTLVVLAGVPVYEAVKREPQRDMNVNV